MSRRWGRGAAGFAGVPGKGCGGDGGGEGSLQDGREGGGAGKGGRGVVASVNVTSAWVMKDIGLLGVKGGVKLAFFAMNAVLEVPGR